LTLAPAENSRVLSFNTVLVKQNDQWQIDYQQTLHNIASQPFSGIIKSLEAIGDTLNRQLQQQIPLIEQEIESFGKELQQQLDEFGRNYKDPQHRKNDNPIVTRFSETGLLKSSTKTAIDQNKPLALDSYRSYPADSRPRHA